MNKLLLEFLSNILNERVLTPNQRVKQRPKKPRTTKMSVGRIRVSVEDQAPGTVEPTKGGRFRAKQVGTNKVLYWGNEEMALAWAKGKKDATGSYEDDAAIGANVPKGTLGKREPFKLDEPKKVADKEAQPTDDEKGVTDSMVDPQGSGSEVVEQLTLSNEALAKARRRGRAGAGGQKASYGEVGLTQAANGFKGDGVEKFVQTNRDAIESEVQAFKAPISDKRENTTRERKFATVARQIGVDITSEEGRNKVIRYLATREVYVQQELARLKQDKSSVLYLKNGFGGNEGAAREWAEAQFDGALATLEVVADSQIDVTQPFVVIQAEGRSDSHDGAIKEHLRTQMESAGTEDDKRHYKEQLHAFEHLGFHDTMAVGVDDKGRLTVFHITNKKGNDLEDIWNNTGPAEAIKTFQQSFARELAGTSNAQALEVGKVLAQGIVAVEDATRAAGMRIADVPFTEDKEFVQAVVAVSSGEKDYTREALSSRTISSFEKELEKRANNGSDTDAETLAILRGLRGNLDKKGEEGIKARLAYIKIYINWVNKNSNDRSKPKGLKITGPMVRIFTKVAEELPSLQKKFGAKFGKDSNALKEATSLKESEKEFMKQLHTDVVEAIAKADGPKGPDEDNGPHTRAYLGTIMASMHFDSMIMNYDANLAAVTGIRSSKPRDFRECLAQMSDFEGPIDTPEDRKKLIDHLLRRCRLNPTTRSIEVVNKNGTHVLAEDSWRTSGISKKIEKKLGESIRDCVKSKADSRRKNNPSDILKPI